MVATSNLTRVTNTQVQQCFVVCGFEACFLEMTKMPEFKVNIQTPASLSLQMLLLNKKYLTS